MTRITMGDDSKFTLHVHVGNEEIEKLKNDGYLLCIAKKVNKIYTVAWERLNFMNENYFEWQDRYQVFAASESKDGLLVEALDDPQGIASGQTCTLDQKGVLSEAKGMVDDSGVFHLNNDFGVIHVGVQALLNGGFKPIFITPKNLIPGTVDLGKSSVLCIMS
jgi:hypothetical protein